MAHKKTNEQRFWPHVDKKDAASCWPWTGWLNKKGYGEAWTGSCRTPAHRLAYEMLVGPIPDGLVIDHLCRNRACVNPAHMEPVTIAENVRRGEGVSGRSVVEARTHCPSGHEHAGENLMIRRGSRECRECNRTRARRYYTPKAQQATA